MSVSYALGFTHDVVKDYYPLHTHDAVEIVWHVGGRGVDILADGDERSFAGNAVVVHGHAEPHGQRNEIAGMDRCILLRVSDDLKQRIGAYQVLPNLSGAALQEEMKFLSSNQQKPAALQAVYNARAEATLLHLLYELEQLDAGAERSMADKMRDAESFMRMNFQEALSNNDIARQVDLSEDYFRHQFKQLYAISPMDFVLRCRLEHAQHLLAHTSLKQQAIAEASGFRSMGYFNTRFSHYMGMSPGAYRKQWR